MGRTQIYYGWISRSFVWFVTIAALLTASPMPAQDASARFPEPNQVTTDYPDAAQSYVALNLLWDALHAKSASPAAISKRGAYYNASQAIRQRQLVAGEKPATDFDNRVRELTMDANFRRLVLERYHVAAVPADAPPKTQAFQVHDVTDSMIKHEAAKAAPVALLTLAVMIFIATIMMRGTSNASLVDGQLPLQQTALLPDSLRTVELPGVEYALGVLSGRVIDKETTLNTTVQTTVRTGQVYSMGNEIHTIPGQVMTSTTTTQTDLVWIETPEGQETSWTFTGGTFKARPGHVLSVIGRAARGGGMAFLMAYNHTTAQLEVFNYREAHLTRRGFLAWMASSLVGAVGFAIVFGMMLSIGPQEQRNAAEQMIYPVALLIEGLVASGMSGAVLVFLVKLTILRRRNAQFEREYLPGLKQFLQQRKV